MLSYQHLYHAGNLADVQKHALLAWVLDYLTQKDKPLSYIETHAGRGLYDLSAPEAVKTGEAAQGVGLLADRLPADHPYRQRLDEVRVMYGPDAYPGTNDTIREVSTAYGTLVSGGYLQRTSADYDEDLCLDPEMAVKFVQVTQPKEWSKLVKQYRDQARDRFVKRLAGEIAKRGTLDVLRKGIRDVGARVRLVFFQPPSGLNPDLQQRYQANLFSVVRQLEYSVKDGDARHRKSLDMALFLNGIPLFTVELKNPLTGQTYKDAIRQYRTTRSGPQEPLLAFGCCLAH